MGEPRLPEDVARVAGVQRLGNLLSSARPGWPWSASLGVFAAMAITIVPAVCISGISGADSTWLYWGLGAVTAVVLLLEIGALVRQRWVLRVHAFEFEHGLVYVESGSVQAFRWEDVQLVRHADYVHGAQGTGGFVYRTVLRGPAGDETAVSDNLAFDRIARRLTDAAVDRARARVARGDQATFGAVTVGPDGLAYEAGRVAWSDLDRVEQTQQEIRIYRRGARRPVARISLGKVPDAAALVRLAAAGLPQ